MSPSSPTSKPSVGFAEEMLQQVPTAKPPLAPCGSSAPSRLWSWQRNEGSMTSIALAARRFPSLPRDAALAGAWSGLRRQRSAALAGGDRTDGRRKETAPSLLPTEGACWKHGPIPKRHRIERAGSRSQQAAFYLFFFPPPSFHFKQDQNASKSNFLSIATSYKISTSAGESCIISQSRFHINP